MYNMIDIPGYVIQLYENQKLAKSNILNVAINKAHPKHLLLFKTKHKTVSIPSIEEWKTRNKLTDLTLQNMPLSSFVVHSSKLNFLDWNANNGNCLKIKRQIYNETTLTNIFINNYLIEL